MKILQYEYKGTGEFDWNFSRTKFNNINLLVGNSATGKTKLLNTLFNLGFNAVRKEFRITGEWRIQVEINRLQYDWHLVSRTNERGVPNIDTEALKILNENDKMIIDRDKINLKFDGTELPTKLSRNESGLSLFQEEELIKPLYKGFSLIKRRTFSSGETNEVYRYSNIPSIIYKNLEKDKSLDSLFLNDLPLNATLFLLKEFFKKDFENLCTLFKEVFPFVKNIEFVDIKDIEPNVPSNEDTPVFCIREERVDKKIPFQHLSSGMQKVLLIMTDLMILPKEAIYVIDEYENSLGSNAIDFLPDYLLGHDIQNQIFISSHNPILINNIPVQNWYVVNRSGNEVTIRYGDELIKRFGKSKQQAFIQLINDPFYIRGVE